VTGDGRKRAASLRPWLLPAIRFRLLEVNRQSISRKQVVRAVARVHDQSMYSRVDVNRTGQLRIVQVVERETRSCPSKSRPTSSPFAFSRRRSGIAAVVSHAERKSTGTVPSWASA